MLCVNACGAPGVPPLTGILMRLSVDVFATNNALPALLNFSPFAPNGGIPFGMRSGTGRTQTDAGPQPPDRFQTTPWNESDMYVLPAASKVSAFTPGEPFTFETVMQTDDAPVCGLTDSTLPAPKSMTSS